MDHTYTELNVFQQILGTTVFAWFLFAPEISEILQGKFIKTIIITLSSILISTRLDIQYFVYHYPQRAIVVAIIIVPPIFLYLKYTNTIIKYARIFFSKKLPREIYVRYLRILRWLYRSEPAEYTQIIEKITFSFVWNNLRVMIILISIFSHFPQKFLLLYFEKTFLFSAIICSIISASKLTKKYPLKVYGGIFMTPWVIFMSFYLLGKFVDPSAFLVYLPFIELLHLNVSSYWITAIKICIIYNLILFIPFVVFSGVSIFVTSCFEGIISILKRVLIQFPIFSSQRLRENNVQCRVDSTFTDLQISKFVKAILKDF